MTALVFCTSLTLFAMVAVLFLLRDAEYRAARTEYAAQEAPTFDRKTRKKAHESSRKPRESRVWRREHRQIIKIS